MAGAHITITVDDAAVKAGLARFASKVANLRPALSEIGEVLTASTKQRFADERGPDGEKWPANKPTTLAHYMGRTKGNYRKNGSLSKRGARRLGGKKILTDGGYLGGGIAPRVSAAQVEVGSGEEYAAVQQFGNPANRFYNTPRGAPAPIPPRPFLGISDEDQADILRILDRYLAP